MTNFLFWRRVPLLYALLPRVCFLPLCPGTAFISPPGIQFLIPMPENPTYLPSGVGDFKGTRTFCDSPGWLRCKCRSESRSLSPYLLLRRSSRPGVLLHLIARLQHLLQACVLMSLYQANMSCLSFLSYFVQLLFSSPFPSFSLSLFSSPFLLLMAEVCID